MDIGLVGAGNMGRAIAGNLLKAGHRVTIYARKPIELVGARVVTDFAPLAGVDVVLTMVSDDAALEQVCASLSRDVAHISMETISPALSARLATERTYIAAPVIGRPEAAAAARLFILAGGPAETIDRFQPLFDVIGQRTFRFATAAAAHSTKLAVNFLIASTLESLGEAVAFARKSGVDAGAFVDLLTSTIFAAPVYQTYGKIIAEERYTPAGFRLPLGLKDVRLVLNAAESVQSPMPFASVIRDQLVEALATGQAEMDWSSIARISARHAGL